MEPITDYTNLREFLLDQGLTPLDAGAVIRNKRIRELFTGRHLQSIEISKLKTQIKTLQSEINTLLNGADKNLRANAGKISKISKEEVWVEIYPDGDFRRYIIGKFNLKLRLNLIAIEADKFCNNRTPLYNGNSLRHGRDSKRICVKCQTEGKIGDVFTIQKTHIDNRCKDCRREYTREKKEQAKKRESK